MPVPCCERLSVRQSRSAYPVGKPVGITLITGNLRWRGGGDSCRPDNSDPDLIRVLRRAIPSHLAAEDGGRLHASRAEVLTAGEKRVPQTAERAGPFRRSPS